MWICEKGGHCVDPCDDCEHYIEVELAHHGRWIINPDGYYPYCSECGEEPQGRIITKWCPNCGAKMDYKYTK